MSLLRTLTDKFKAAPSVSNVTGKSVLLTDGNGDLGKTSCDSVLPGLNADMLDGKHRTDIVRYEYNPTTEISLNDRRVFGGIDIFDYNYATSGKVNNTPFGDKVSGAGAAYTFGSSYAIQLFNSYDGRSLLFRGLYTGNWTSWREFAFTDSNVASAKKLQDSSGVFLDRTAWNALVARVAALENNT